MMTNEIVCDWPPTQQQMELFVYMENKDTLHLLSSPLPDTCRVITFISPNTGSSLSRGKLTFPSPQFSPFSPSSLLCASHVIYVCNIPLSTDSHAQLTLIDYYFTTSDRRFRIYDSEEMFVYQMGFKWQWNDWLTPRPHHDPYSLTMMMILEKSPIRLGGEVDPQCIFILHPVYP